MTYAKTFNEKHNFDILLGHEYYDDRYYYLSAGKSNMFSQDNKELAGAVIDGQSAYSYKTRYNNEGYIVLSDYQNQTAFDPGACTRGLYLRGLE